MRQIKNIMQTMQFRTYHHVIELTIDKITPECVWQNLETWDMPIASSVVVTLYNLSDRIYGV